MQELKYKHQFAVIYKSLQDAPDDLEKCIELLNIIVRTKSDPPPPILEFITILKHEKPVLYVHVKRRMQIHRTICLLFELDSDYEQAKRRFGLE